MELKWKKVAVLGAARTGISCASFFSSQDCHVLLSEINPRRQFIGVGVKKKEETGLKIPYGIETEFGGHSKKVLEADLIVPSPGVPFDSSILREARKKNIEIISDIEIFYLLAKYRMIIAVTGTNGKTTTVSMLEYILKNLGEKAVVCGNIGAPVCDFIEKSDKNTSIIMEVSSYQLEYTNKFTPHISVILNITPDHLERHKTMENYADIKAKIFLNQNKEDFSIFNKEDMLCYNLSNKCISQRKFFSLKENKKKLELKVPGDHNIENALASIEVIKAMGRPDNEILKALYGFSGVEHRLEFVREIKGVKYINDSKGTNVSSTETAIKAFEQPIVLILGGRDKGSSYAPLIPLIKRNVKKVIVIGEAKEKILSELKGSAEIIILDNIEQAVKKANQVALPGDIVLLSPACASFDQFKNYEERGDFFKEVVKNL
ncbi:MAG: UDP-N-acetylmuramoyl-L-alanine--D-glutamate ligase [Elusimicrobia bacterium]|nr:UDP-N-acetylmuramoyl-L-alanine--D-glutamate ligase [Elusimicrobiota bacterium]